MNLLYESDNFEVTHMVANAAYDEEQTDVKFEREGGTHKVLRMPILTRDGFEIINKHTNKGLYLDGAWAEIFRQRIEAWRVNMPSQDEVEDTLDGFAELAQNPVVEH